MCPETAEGLGSYTRKSLRDMLVAVVFIQKIYRRRSRGFTRPRKELYAAFMRASSECMPLAVCRMALVFTPPPLKIEPSISPRAPTPFKTAPVDAAPAPKLGETILIAGQKDIRASLTLFLMKEAPAFAFSPNHRRP